MKTEFDDLRSNENHQYDVDSNGNKQVVKIYRHGKLIAKKLVVKKSVRYFGYDNYQQYLTPEA